MNKRSAARQKNIKYSISAVNSLRRCGRQFLFQQIVASPRAKDPIRKKAQLLKSMKSLAMWKGSVVETVINEYLLTSGRHSAVTGIIEISRDELIDKALELAKKQLEYSANKKYKYPDVDKRSLEFCVLDIHEVDQEYEDEDLQLVFDDIEQSIRNLYTLDVEGRNILEVIKSASWYKPNIMNYSFEFDNIRVTPQIDLLLYLNNKPVIIDWKVSDNVTNDYSRQMTICAIAVKYMNDRQGRPKLPYQDISIHEINLLLPLIKTHVVEAKKVGEVVDYIYSTAGDIALMKDHVSYEHIDVKKYEMTDKSSTCSLCNFQTLCKQVVEQNHKLSHDSCYQLF